MRQPLTHLVLLGEFISLGLHLRMSSLAHAAGEACTIGAAAELQRKIIQLSENQVSAASNGVSGISARLNWPSTSGPPPSPQELQRVDEAIQSFVNRVRDAGYDIALKDIDDPYAAYREYIHRTRFGEKIDATAWREMTEKHFVVRRKPPTAAQVGTVATRSDSPKTEAIPKVELKPNDVPANQSPSTPLDAYAKMFPDPVDSSRSLEMLEQDVNQLQAKLRLQLAPIQREVIEKRIEQIYASMQSGPNAAKALPLIKNHLISKYFRTHSGADLKSELSKLSETELSEAIASLKALRAESGNPAYQGMIDELLKPAENAYFWHPAVKAKRAEQMPAASAQHKAQQSQAALEYRRATQYGSALSSEKRGQVDGLIEKLNRDPYHLSKDEAREVRQALTDFEKRRGWSDGGYSGIHPDEAQRADALDTAVKAARERISNRVNGIQGTLSEGRRPSKPTMPVNSRDAINGQGRVSRVLNTNAEAQRQTQPWQDEIANQLGLHSLHSARANLEYRPIIPKTQFQDYLSSIQRQGIALSKEEFENLNLASCVDAINADRSGVDYTLLDSSLRKLSPQRIQEAFSDPAKQRTLDLFRRIAEYHLSRQTGARLDF